MIVTMPDGIDVEFPDDMPREKIKGIIEKKYPKEVGEFKGIDVSKLDVNNVMSDDGLNSQPSSKIDVMLSVAKLITPKDSELGRFVRRADWGVRTIENTDFSKLGTEGAKSAGRAINASVVGGTGFLVKMAGDMFYPEYNAKDYEADTVFTRVKKFKDDSNRAVFGAIRDFGQSVQDFSERVNTSEYLKADEKLFAGDWEQNPNLHKVTDLVMSGATSVVGAYVMSSVAGPAAGLMLFSGIDAKDLYEEAREKGVSKGKAFGTWLAGTAGTAYLEKFGVESAFGIKIGRGGMTKIVDATKSTTSKITDAMLANAGEEYLQTVWQNLCAKVGYDEGRNIFQNAVESAVGGAFGGGLVASFNFGYQAFKSKSQKAGLTQQEQDNVITAVGQAIANNPDMVDVPFQENMKKTYASFQQMIKELGDTPEAERLKETKRQLDEVYSKTFEQLKDKMPEKQAKAVSDIARSSALFFSDLEGMSVGEWFEKNAPQIKKVDSIENEIRQFAKNIEPIKTRLDLEDINLFEALKNPDIVKRYREKDTRSSLLQFIKKRGGAVDSGGELKAMDIGKNVIGAINNKSGESLDDLALAAWENGYFPEKTERPTVNELLEAIRDESFGKKRYAEEKQADLEDMVADLSEALDRMNIDYQNMTAQEIEQAYNDYLADMEERSAMNAEYADEASRAEDIFDLSYFQVADENQRLDEMYPAYEGETITINGQEKTVYNSNGDRIAKSKEALENFYNWFGDSKVVDEQGRPLVVYHGTSAEFDTFRKGNIFTTDNQEVASEYGSLGAMPLYMKLENPLIVDAYGQSFGEIYNAEGMKKAYKDLTEEDYKKLADTFFDGDIKEAKEWYPQNEQGEVNLARAYGEKPRATNEWADYARKEGYDGVIIKDVNDTVDISNIRTTDYVAFNPNQVKSTSNRGTYSESENIYYQEGDDRDLVALHSISASNLEKAIDFGGFPVPSIAIVKKGQEFHFDDLPITLVGNKEMIDPYDERNEVYNRDVWTKTFPWVTYKKPTQAKEKSFKNKIGEYYKRTNGENELGSFIYVAQRGDTSSALSQFQSSSGAMLYYLENIKKQKVEFAEKDLASDILERAGIDETLANEIQGLDVDTDRDKITKAFKRFLERKEEEDFSDIKDTEKREKMIKFSRKLANENYFDKESGNIHFNKADTIVTAADNYFRSKGKKFIDLYEVRRQLRDMIANDENYQEWATEFFEKELVGDKMVRVGNALKPFTLENVVDAMTTGATVSSQETPLPAMGKVIAAGAKRLETIRDIKEEGKKLVTLEQSKENMEKVKETLYDFLNMFEKGDDFSRNMDRKDAVATALQGVLKNKNITKESLKKAILRQLPSDKTVSDEVLSYGVELANEIKGLARYYFEAKPQRAIGLNEFSAAIMPTSTEFDTIAKKVEDAGLKVVRSDNQTEALQEIDTEDNVFFQSAFHGSPNKELEGGKFDLKYAGKTTGNVHGYGVYAVVSKPSAEYWAGENGQVYELDVPEDFELIDEQKGFDEQSEKVRYAILGALEKINGFGLLEKAVLDNMPGGEIYVALGKDVFFDKHGYEGGSTEIMKAASEFLDKLGIKGITYDYANEKNFVIFNPADVKVIQKFYQGEQSPLGAYVNRIIYLSKNANASTLPHELFHFWSDMLRSSKSLRAKEILREVDKWANKEFDRKYSTIKTENGYAVVDKSGKTIYDRMGEGFATEEQARAYAKEELFARGGEKYLSEGKAPSKTLRQAFANFYNWLKKIYVDMMSLDIKLSKPMRDVYATILGGTSIDTFLDSDIDEFIEKRAEAEREKDMEVREIIQQAQGVKPVTLPEKIRKAYEEFDFGETWKKIMIPLSTRAKRVAPTLRNKIRRYEFDVLETKQAYYREIEPMLKKWKEFSKEDSIAFDLALKNGAIDIRDEILRKYNAVDDFAKVTETLEDIYYKANDAGLEVGYIEDYFPRKVKDKDGLLSYLHGTDEWSGFQEALHREDPHGQFSAEEQAEFIDKYLRGIVRADLAAYKYSSEKARKLDTIDNVLNQYYADSMQALIAYIDGMNARISTVNFFGRNRENVDESIGEFVAYLLNNNEIKPSQVDEVKSILNAVFKRRGVGSKWIKAGRDMSYIYTMGGVNTAITQLDDIFVAAYKGGVINTFSAAFQKDRVTKKDLGLDSIAAEFVEGSGVSKAVNWVFKHNGIELIDGFGKNALLNGVLKKMEQMSDADLRKYLEPVMEEETEQTMKDIRNGELSANVRFFLFNELSDMQPVSLSELPELYNVGGNARIFYMLKSFMLKRIDTLRNEVYDKMRSSDQATRIEGWKNMYRLILLMMLGGATKDLIIDLMYNRAIDLNDTVVNNLLGMVGISKYNIYQVREEGMGHTLAIFATPPLFSVAEDLSGDVNKYIAGKREFKDFEVFKGLPIIGRFYYWLYGGGKTKTEKKKKKQR